MNHSVLASLSLPPRFLRLELRVEASEFSALLPQRLLCPLPTGPLCTQSLAFKEEKQTEAGTVLALSATRSQGAEWGAGGTQEDGESAQGCVLSWPLPKAAS